MSTRTSREAAFVVDVPPPWRARVLVQGPGPALTAGDVPDGVAVIRLVPTGVTSWGLDGSRRAHLGARC
ncbi:hypothetical protein FHR93_002261 [Geodermatophilus sabuli]|uniref:Uncharacterized protein n=1 Tax=Geodermatophilus sabuli TaxID=1564158 RepID=A0A285EKK6_9ACTN|nr:hypothetical protein [Geodermatophilus sabuli]SNX98694.1 hypothetical protein SAMN06893097_111210 [Geodermatophilus sabuli]